MIQGQNYTFEEAFEIAKREGHLDRFPLPLLMALVETREDGGKHLSPSQANACHRQGILKGEEDYYLNPEQLIGSYLGRSAHKGMELNDLLITFLEAREITIPKAHTELKLSMELEVPVTYDHQYGVDFLDLHWERETDIVPFKLEGTTDRYDIESQRIQDWKWIGDWVKYDPRLKRGADRTAADVDHILQINLYRLLLEVNGYPVKSAQIFYAAAYKDARRNVFDIELWDLEDTLQLATELAEPLARYELLGELPPPLTEDDPRFWLCARCPVYDICQRLAKEER